MQQIIASTKVKPPAQSDPSSDLRKSHGERNRNNQTRNRSNVPSRDGLCEWSKEQTEGDNTMIGKLVGITARNSIADKSIRPDD